MGHSPHHKGLGGVRMKGRVDEKNFFIAVS